MNKHAKCQENVAVALFVPRADDVVEFNSTKFVFITRRKRLPFRLVKRRVIEPTAFERSVGVETLRGFYCETDERTCV